VSNYLEQKVLEWIFKKTALPAVPTGLWVSLHSADPGDTGANELAGTGSYAARGARSGHEQLDEHELECARHERRRRQDHEQARHRVPTATADWNGQAAITKFALWDASSGGNCLWSGTISASGVVVLNGNTLKFTGGSPGQFAITLD